MRNVVPSPRWLLTLMLPLVLLDDAVDGRQAQAGALARLLGGEERLEDVLLDLRRHAAAGVAHGQAARRARPAGPGASARTASSSVDGGGLDRQPCRRSASRRGR